MGLLILEEEELERIAAISAQLANENQHVISDIIRLSNEEEFLTHGIKHNSNVTDVMIHGIQPLTPEGGYASYWNTGARIFGKLYGDRLLTGDSTLFRWAHSNDPDAHHRYMTLALARYRDLSSLKNKTPFEQNGYVKIAQAVPPEIVRLIRIDVEMPGLDRCNYSTLAERLMLRELHSTMKYSFSPGITSIKQPA